MIELNRPILLPPPGAAGVGRARPGGLAGKLAPIPPVQGLPAGRPWRLTGDEAGEAAGWSGKARPPGEDDAARPRARGGILDGTWSDSTWTEPGPGPHAGRGGAHAPAGNPAGSAAFLAQQIFQETMSVGLHLEPWVQGIGAYRRAGAEPPLGDSRATVLSLAV